MEAAKQQLQRLEEQQAAAEAAVAVTAAALAAEGGAAMTPAAPFRWGPCVCMRVCVGEEQDVWAFKGWQEVARR